MRLQYLFLFICILASIQVNADTNTEYPLEFTDFFTEQAEIIEVVIAGSAISQMLEANVSYDTFKIADSQSLKVLREYLKEQNLTSTAIDGIGLALSQGIPANPGCKGALSRCIPKDIPSQAEYVFDFDARQLRIFVSTDLLESFSDEKEYFSSLRTDSALINWSDLYITNNSTQTGLSWSNNSLVGLPLGYISLDTQYQSVDNKLDIYRGLYDIEIDSVRAVLGYQENSTISFNSTDILTYGTNVDGFSFSLGSSQNLLKGQPSAQKRIYFFAPESAQLEIYKGERLLLTKVVSQGKQSIGYDQLPSGIYNLTLKLKQGEKTLLNETRQVVNTQQFNLAVNKWDYRLDAGLFNKRLQDDNSSASELKTYREYIRALASYRPTEAFIASVGGMSNRQSHLIQAGGTYAFLDSLITQFSIGYFTGGSIYQYGQVSYHPFSISYRQVDIENDTLAQQLYGNNSSREWGASFSGDVWGGNGFISYFHYENSDQQTKNISDSISASWARPFMGGTLSLNTTYSIYDNNQGGLTTNLVWSRKIGTNWSGRMGVILNDEQFTSNQNAVTYQKSEDLLYGSITAGTSLYQSGELEATLSGTITGNTPQLGYSSYGFIDSNGEYSLSGNLSGTQIVSSNQALTTYKQGKAFIEISPSNEQDDDKNVSMNYSLLQDDRPWQRNEINAGDNHLIEVPAFSDINYILDFDMNNVDVDIRNFQYFAMPGGYYHFSSKVSPLLSQVFILNDMFNKPVTTVRCLGDGCRNVETLSDDGVFRVNYQKNAPFKLVSDKRLCVYNPEDMGLEHVQAYCLPGLDKVDGGIVWEDRPELIETADIQRALLYIGKYESSEEAEQILNTLKTVGLDSKYIEVGDDLYVYVRYRTEYTTAQRALLESLEAYVILNTIDINHLFTVR